MTEEQAASPALVRSYRVMVIACGALNLALAGWGYVEADLVSDETAAAMQLTGAQALLVLPQSVWWVLLVLYTAAVFGLCAFWKTARTVFTVMFVCFTALSLLSGLMVTTAITGFLGGVWGTLQGAILGLSYAPPLGKRFR